MSDEFSSPLAKPKYMDMRKGHEFLLKNLLEANKTGAQILQDTSGVSKQQTERSGRSREDFTTPANTKRSDQVYKKQQSFNRNNLPEGKSHPPLQKKPTLVRMHTLEVKGSPNDRNQDDLDMGQQQLKDLAALTGNRTKVGDTVEKPHGALRHAEILGETLNQRAQVEARPSDSHELNRARSGSMRGGLPVNIVDQRSAQVDLLLKEWDGKLMRVEDRLTKNKRVKEQLLSDYSVMEQESRKVAFQISEKNSQVEELKKLIADSRDAVDKITKSMRGLTSALEREKSLKFK